MLGRDFSSRLRHLTLGAFAALSLTAAGCGGKVETITLAGQSVPKLGPDVAISSPTELGNQDSQTATYSGAELEDFDKHVGQLKKAGWNLVSRTQTVAGLMGILAKDKSQATVSWSPSGGLLVNIRVPKAPKAVEGTPRP